MPQAAQSEPVRPGESRRSPYASPQSLPDFFTRLLGALHCFAVARGGVTVPLDELDEGPRAALLETLGTGHTTLRIATSGTTRLAETGLRGLWHITSRDAAGTVLTEGLEMADVPTLIRTVDAHLRPLTVPGSDEDGAAAVLDEVRGALATWRRGSPNVVLRLADRSLEPQARAALWHALGRGPVSGECTRDGLCRARLTGVRHVWWVEHPAPGGGPADERLEVGDVPGLLGASAEDLARSEARLVELAEASR